MDHTHQTKFKNVLQIQEKDTPYWNVWSRKKQDIRKSPSYCTWHWRGFLGGCIQVWAPCLSHCVAQLEGGQRQAPSEIRGLENVASEESLQLISLKKKVLRRQHHNTQKNGVKQRGKAHSLCPQRMPDLGVLPACKRGLHHTWPCKDKAYQALQKVACGASCTSLPNKV